VSRRGRPVAGTGRHAKFAIRQDRKTAARERRAGLDDPPATVDPDRLVEEARRLREANGGG
jgi:hypothetical protein